MFFDILKYIINLNETSEKKRILTIKDKDFFQTISFQNKKLIYDKILKTKHFLTFQNAQLPVFQ